MQVTDQFRQAAANAISAGFDGVEIHAANGVNAGLSQSVCQISGWSSSYTVIITSHEPDMCLLFVLKLHSPAQWCDGCRSHARIMHIFSNFFVNMLRACLPVMSNRRCMGSSLVIWSIWSGPQQVNCSVARMTRGVFGHQDVFAAQNVEALSASASFELRPNVFRYWYWLTAP